MLSACTQTGIDEMREAYRRKLELNMRNIANMSRAVAIVQVVGGENGG